MDKYFLLSYKKLYCLRNAVLEVLSKLHGHSFMIYTLPKLLPSWTFCKETIMTIPASHPMSSFMMCAVFMACVIFQQYPVDHNISHHYFQMEQLRIFKLPLKYPVSCRFAPSLYLGLVWLKTCSLCFTNIVIMFV